LEKETSKITESLFFAFFVFLIIGKNNPKIYKRIIAREIINIALTAFIFIFIISL
tara:strand:- start:1187 stop:1351 length:165 start_codon:yes stop_codon:yes gene_type:complete